MRPSSCGSLASLSDGTCWVGITRRWVGAWGLMSRNAISPSPRFTIVAGISPAATLQKRQPDMGPLPSERLADLLPELLAAALFRRRLRLDHGEPLQQLLLLRRETRGGPDPHTHVQVAPPALAQPRQALAPHAVHRAGLRPRLDLEQHGPLPVRRGDLHVAAQRRLTERDRQVEDQVVAVALEPGILGDVEHRDEIARRPAARPRHALSAHREVVVVRDAGRHVDLHRLLDLDPAVAAALGTRIRDHRSLAAARGTGRDGDELPEHRARVAPHLPGAAARAAGRGPRALLGARAAARRAAIQRAHAHGLRRPRGDFGQRELECHLQVRPTVPVASALAAAEDRVEPAQAPEVAHEDVERLGQVEMREAEPALPAPPGARRTAPQARFTVAVVDGALVGIAQHLVRLGEPLEPLLGVVALVAIGMVVHRELAIGLLDVGLGSVATHSQNPVVVRRPHASSSPTRRLVWSTSATILSYGMRVGPRTPITPARGPMR